MVRVYSKSLEQNEFPIPRTLRVTRKSIVLPPDEVDGGHVHPPDTIQLHKLIRDHHCPLSEPICAMDKRIETDPTGISISDQELKEYRQQIFQAEKHVLTNCDVVLCTCTESASKRIRIATNIQQVKYFVVFIQRVQNVLLNVLNDSRRQVDHQLAIDCNRFNRRHSVYCC